MDKELKYGHIHGSKMAVPVEIAASQTLKAQSGRFVYMDATGQANLNEDGSNRIFGHLEAGDESPSQGDVYNCIIDKNAVFRIPINSGTYTKAMIGDTCDISVSSDVQGAQLDASVENTLIVVGGDATNNNWVEVIMNPTYMGTGNGVDA
jgi:hypothetical protein